MRRKIVGGFFTLLASVLMVSVTPFIGGLYAEYHSHSATEARRLYLVGNGQERGKSESTTPSENLFSMPAFLEFARDNTVFSEVSALRSFSSRVEINSPDRTLACPCNGSATAVTTNYFGIVGTKAKYGQLLSASNNSDGIEPQVVLAEQYWMTAFHGDQGIIGNHLLIAGHPFKVVGILPKEFSADTGAVPADLWIPLSAEPEVFNEPDILGRANTYWLLIVGRLPPTISIGTARSAVARQLRDILVQESVTSARTVIDTFDFQLKPVSETLPSGLQHFHILYVTIIVTCLVLLGTIGIILATVDGHLQNDGSSDGDKLRIADWHFLRAICYGLVAGAIGAGAYMTGWITAIADWSQRLIGGTTPRLGTAFTLFWLTVGFCIWTAGSSALLARSKAGPNHRKGIPSGILVSILLLTTTIAVAWCYAAGLLAVRLHHLSNTIIGIGGRQAVLQATILPKRVVPESVNIDPGSRNVERLTNLPEIVGASLSSTPLLENGPRQFATVHVQGHSPFSEANDEAEIKFVTPSYFSTVGLRLLAGRLFPPNAASPSAETAVVNDTFVKEYFGQQIPFDVPMRIGALNRDVTIIGEVSSIRTSSSDDLAEPTVYLPTTEHGPVMSALQLRVRRIDDFQRDRLHADISQVLSNYIVGSIQPLMSHQRQALIVLYQFWCMAALAVVSSNICMIGVLYSPTSGSWRRECALFSMPGTMSTLWKVSTLILGVVAVGIGVLLSKRALQPLFDGGRAIESELATVFVVVQCVLVLSLISRTRINRVRSLLPQ